MHVKHSVRWISTRAYVWLDLRLSGLVKVLSTLCLSTRNHGTQQLLHATAECALVDQTAKGAYIERRRECSLKSCV
jgi:hypothetical protein